MGVRVRHLLTGATVSALVLGLVPGTVPVAPGLVEDLRLVASDAAPSDQFGWAVAISGDTAVVGADLSDTPGGTDAGAVYVFERSGTAWVEQAVLTASDGAPGDRFGFSVDVSDNFVVVGAPLDDTAHGADAGSVYVFRRSGDSWSEVQHLSGGDRREGLPSAGDQIGHSVAVSAGHVVERVFVVAGAPFADTDAGTDAGEVYLATSRDDGEFWFSPVVERPDDGAALDQFGTSVAVDGAGFDERIVVGSPGDDTKAGLNAGSAYVFEDVDGITHDRAKLTASDASRGDGFGWAVALSEETAIVGAPFDQLGMAVAAGSAYAFVGPDNMWSEQAKLTASHFAANDQFGFSVALSGDTALIGALADDVGGRGDAGSAYAYVRPAATWTESQQLVVSDSAPSDFLGRSVDVFGETALVGAPLDNTPDGNDAGSALVFTIATDTTPPTLVPEQTVAGEEAVDRDGFGSTVAVDGDTAVIGVPDDDRSGGSVFVYTRDGNRWIEQAHLAVADGRAEFGSAVALRGDTLVVGAPDYITEFGTGAAFVFVRTQGRWNDGPVLTPSGPSLRFGSSVALGESRLVVGSPNDGAVLVFVRDGATWMQEQRLTPSVTPPRRFGESVALDQNETTVVVGAPQDDFFSGMSAGSAYVFVRSGTTWAEQAHIVPADLADFARFGTSLAIAGDTLAVGAPGADPADPDTPSTSGAVLVFTRSGTAWAEQDRLTSAQPAIDDRFGLAAVFAGDELLVGAPGLSSVSVFARTDTGWTEGNRLKPSVPGEGFFGKAVAVDDDVAILGSGDPDDPGSAYAAVRTSRGWRVRTKITAPLTQAEDAFGAAVALSGTTGVVGAPFANTRAGKDAGSAHVVTRSGPLFHRWRDVQRLEASDADGGDQFGFATAIDQTTAVVGAPRGDSGRRPNTGSVYVFVLEGSRWIEQAKLVADDADRNDDFGFSVAIAGDTILVGARRDDTDAGKDAGSVYVFARSATTWTQQAHLLASDATARDQFGFSVALDGDTAVIGAPADDTQFGEADAGSAHVFTRSGGSWGLQQQLIAPDGLRGSLFGLSVDVSGQTVLIGAPQDDAPTLDSGSAYVFVRTDPPWALEQKLTPSHPGTAADFFGWNVALDGDRALIGAPQDPFFREPGFASVFERTGTEWEEAFLLGARDTVQGDAFAERVALDGSSALIGAHFANTAQGVDAGAVHAFAVP